MRVTIQQIADRAGVSRGTVDRALNHRGRISPEAEQRILDIAAEMGYVPRNKKEKAEGNVKIGVVTQLAKSSFMLEVNRGIRDAAKELQERGVKILLEEGLSVDGEEQAAAIDRLLEQGIDGLAVMPVDCDAIRRKINQAAGERNLPVITFNSDIAGARRACYVGMDNKQSGRAAAGLMAAMTRGVGKILVITGFYSNYVDNMRVEGFADELKKSFPELELAGVLGSMDERMEVERIIVNTMMGMQGITGIFVVSGGQEGIEAAFQRLQLDKRPYVIVYDLTPENKELLKNHAADFLIDQEGYVQGYQPPYILADMLQKGIMPEREHIYTDIHIKTKYNI